MQYISNGPDVPDELLQLHEDGEVVFFCGAGISMGAGLPNFKNLVRRTWKEIGYAPSVQEKKLLRMGQCEIALNLLEKTVYDSGTMRGGLARVLSRYRSNGEADRTHKALLTLSKTMGEKACLHLVTTNCDRLFENLGEQSEWRHNSYVAPLLPVPKKTNWDGIVYLHGLLQKENTEDSLKNLVMTSGDFGRAYLKEGWAARFVSELFREYAVCFVGYSLDDPVMRYLADAIEADKAEGEEAKPIFMFVPETAAESLNRSTSITCIRYSDANDHEALHNTLAEWAKCYSKGVYGKEEMVDACADIDPDKTPDNGFVGQLLWALSDMKGTCAQRFATHAPVPSLNWAKILMSEKVLPPVSRKEEKRPLLSLSADDSHQDIRKIHLWNWLLRHLNNPDLVWMVLREGNTLHQGFKYLLSSALTAQLGNVDNTGGTRLHPMMLRLWRLILADKVRSSASKCFLDIETHNLLRRFKTEKLDYALLRDLRHCLTPAILLEKSFRARAHPYGKNDGGEDPKSHFECSLCLRDKDQAGDHFIREARKLLVGRFAEVFDWIEAALLEGLEALSYLDAKAEDSFAIIQEIRSIEDHSQNKERFYTWGSLIDLLRDAWVELASKDKQKASATFNRWITSKHTLFQRLALFAAKRSDVVDPHEWCNCLLDNHAYLLWKISVQREVLRLLATTAKDLPEADFALLGKEIALGPPTDLEGSEDADLRDRTIWLRLKKLECREQALPESARCKLADISARHPAWSLLRNQLEEFLFWSSGTGDPDFEAEKQHISVPEQLDEMVDWLANDINAPKHSFETDDNWQQICRERPLAALAGLETLATKNQWNTERMEEALSVWRVKSHFEYGCQLVENHILSCPVDIFGKISNTVALWCEEVAKEKAVPGEFVLRVAKRILSQPHEADDLANNNSFASDPISTAINHPVGRITEALLSCCFDKTIHKGDGIPKIYKDVFSEICSTPSLMMRHGRVILSSRMVGLYYAAEDWVREYLYPLLDWECDHDEALAAWYGLLWTNRPYPPIMSEIKPYFLCASTHLKGLEHIEARYCSFLTLMGLWHVPGYNRADYRKIVATFSLPALEHCADTLRRYQMRWMNSDKSPRDDRTSPERIWKKDVKPFIHTVWPKDIKKVSKEICRSFAQLVVATGEEFQDAFQTLKWILKSCPLEFGWLLRMMKRETKCLQDSPEVSLDFLMIASKGIMWDIEALRECLDEIVQARPALKLDGRYLHLMNLARP